MGPAFLEGGGTGAQRRTKLAIKVGGGRKTVPTLVSTRERRAYQGLESWVLKVWGVRRNVEGSDTAATSTAGGLKIEIRGVGIRRELNGARWGGGMADHRYGFREGEKSSEREKRLGGSFKIEKLVRLKGRVISFIYYGRFGGTDANMRGAYPFSSIYRGLEGGETERFLGVLVIIPSLKGESGETKRLPTGRPLFDSDEGGGSSNWADFQRYEGMKLVQTSARGRGGQALGDPSHARD